MFALLGAAIILVILVGCTIIETIYAGSSDKEDGPSVW